MERAAVQLTAQASNVVPQPKATRHGRSAERAVKPRLIGRHQLAVHLPVTPAANTQQGKTSRTTGGIYLGSTRHFIDPGHFVCIYFECRVDFL